VQKSEENSICETSELYRTGWRDHMLRMHD